MLMMISQSTFPRRPRLFFQPLSGLSCYVNTIHFTVAANFLAIVLSVWAGYRGRQKIASSQRRLLPRGEVTWEDEERDSEVLPSYPNR